MQHRIGFVVWYCPAVLTTRTNGDESRDKLTGNGCVTCSGGWQVALHDGPLYNRSPRTLSCGVADLRILSLDVSSSSGCVVFWLSSVVFQPPPPSWTFASVRQPRASTPLSNISMSPEPTPSSLLARPICVALPGLEFSSQPRLHRSQRIHHRVGVIERHHIRVGSRCRPGHFPRHPRRRRSRRRRPLLHRRSTACHPFRSSAGSSANREAFQTRTTASKATLPLAEVISTSLVRHISPKCHSSRGYTTSLEPPSQTRIQITRFHCLGVTPWYGSRNLCRRTRTYFRGPVGFFIPPGEYLSAPCLS